MARKIKCCWTKEITTLGWINASHHSDHVSDSSLHNQRDFGSRPRKRPFRSLSLLYVPNARLRVLLTSSSSLHLADYSFDIEPPWQARTVSPHKDSRLPR